MERTFLMVKPDGVQRKMIGEIINRLESKGLKPIAMKLLQIDKDLAEKHYNMYKGKPFFQDLIKFISSSPVLAMVWEGRDIITQTRALMGSTDPAEAKPGTIRGDLALSIDKNIIHGSDSLEAARREIALFFTSEELISYEQNIDQWV